MIDNAKWAKYETLRPTEIESICKKNPIAYLPWGALEYHGSHNPIGLDGIKAYGLCCDLAKQNGGIVLPTVFQAANLISSYQGVDFKKHSIEFSEKLIKLTAEEYIEQLAKQDFKIIVLLSGHAGEPHLQILRDIADYYNKKKTATYVYALAEFDIIPDHLLVANHSAIGETSLQLYYQSDFVDLDSLPKDRDISLEIDAVYGDDPRPATKELGAEIAETFVKNASKEISELKKRYL
ncbi:MAG: creatininase family protein [Flavobacteriales bacterium]|nr:creatininase family protein [Flavobacteriales bacterium]